MNDVDKFTCKMIGEGFTPHLINREVRKIKNKNIGEGTRIIYRPTNRINADTLLCKFPVLTDSDVVDDGFITYDGIQYDRALIELNDSCNAREFINAYPQAIRGHIEMNRYNTSEETTVPCSHLTINLDRLKMLHLARINHSQE